MARKRRARALSHATWCCLAIFIVAREVQPFCVLSTTLQAGLTGRNQKVAVVTGGNRGVGKEICKQLCKQGMRVILTARSPSKGKRAADELGQDCDFMQCDVTDSMSISKLRGRLMEEYGSVDCLVNNAAIGLKNEPFTRASASKLFQTNCFGALSVSRALLPLMSSGGRVVMVSSRSGSLSRFSPSLQAKLQGAARDKAALQHLSGCFLSQVDNGTWRGAGWPSAGVPLPPLPGLSGAPVVEGRMWLRATELGLYFTSGPHHTAYCVSKALLNAGARLLAADANPHAVSVHACCPGWVRTDMAGPLAPSSIAEGAATPVFLASRPPSAEAVEAQFYADCRPIPW